jgi:pimeloyl-ACP methyl ester carboxylesterase
MSRVLLLCFLHGFKGTDNTFRDFPPDLEQQVAKRLPDHHVQSVIYPKYETKGELAQATEAFVEWLKERVIDCRKEHLDNPWPPTDRNVGVILVAHSMGGFVAADALFLTLRDRKSETDPIFPLIQGILAFDTPYNGLARSMFVYGAFSNYQKVSNVFNAMTALSVAAPASIGRLAGNRRAAPAAAAVSSSAAGTSTAWQLLAVRTGTVGAIAAGGVAAYMHREAIMKGVRNIKNLNRASVVEGYHQGVGALGQGLAYINRGNVGRSFAWLSDHFTFVGSLLKQKELCRRLDRLAALGGIGVHDFYCSLGENGYWSGGYFVPERTFCAIPSEEHPARALFERRVMAGAGDEVEAHVSIFRPEKNKGYENILERSARLVEKWFLSDEPVVDAGRWDDGDVGAEETSVDEEVEKTEKAAEEILSEEGKEEETGIPDESPVNIAAAAALVPLPDSEESLLTETGIDDTDTDEKRTYLQHLLRVAQQAGSGAKDWWPSKVPDMSNLPKTPGNMLPKMQMPSAVSSLGQSVQVPKWTGLGIGTKTHVKGSDTDEVSQDQVEGTRNEPDVTDGKRQ